MKNVKKIITAALITMFATSLIGCNMIEKTPKGIANSSVAKVFGSKITRGDVDEQLAGFYKQLETQYGTSYKTNTEAKSQITTQKQQVLEELITEKITDYKAVELKLMPTDAQLNAQVNNQLAQIKSSAGTDAKFTEALAQASLTEAQLKERIIKPGIIYNIVQSYITKNVKVTQAQEKAYYNANPNEFTDGSIHVAHILVATEPEAKAIKKRLDAGETFAKLAKEKGTDATKDKGGDLGTLKYNDAQMDKTFMKAAIKVKQGTISQPVKTQYGWHIIKSIKNTATPEKKFATVKSSIEKTLITTEQTKLWTAAMKKWQTEAKIVKYANNL